MAECHIFKPSSAGFDSEFSFFLTCCYTKVKEPCLPQCLLMVRKIRIHAFPKGISTKWKANSLIQNLNSTHQVYILRW